MRTALWEPFYFNVVKLKENQKVKYESRKKPCLLLLVEMNPDHCNDFGVRDRKRWMGPLVFPKELTVAAAKWLSRINLLKDFGNICIGI